MKEKMTRQERLEMTRLAAFIKANQIARHFRECGFDSMLINRAYNKRMQAIKQATTIEELNQITKLSEPVLLPTGIRTPTDRFHLEEEEVMLWSEASLKAPLNQEGFNRYLQLFIKFYPEHKNLLLGGITA